VEAPIFPELAKKLSKDMIRVLALKMEIGDFRINAMNRKKITWKIGAEPVTLTDKEFWARYSHFNMPEKFEATGWKLFWNDEQRLHVLAMLLEAVGLKRAVGLCTPEAVKEVCRVYDL
jgi:hypothetical protein